MKLQNILLDQDGVLADFFTLAFERCNAYVGGSKKIEDYNGHGTFQSFDMCKFFDLSIDQFWNVVDFNYGGRMFKDIKPFPWAFELYNRLNNICDVTIVTSPPPHNIDAFSQKAKWLKNNLDIDNQKVMIGSRKYLMAKEGNVLIDDWDRNCDNFESAGGFSIQVESNWNTSDLSLETVWNTIEIGLERYKKL